MNQEPGAANEPPPNPLAQILRDLQDPAPARRAAAITGLAPLRLADRSILAALERIALADPDMELRQSALEALNWPQIRNLRRQPAHEFMGIFLLGD